MNHIHWSIFSECLDPDQSSPFEQRNSSKESYDFAHRGIALPSHRHHHSNPSAAVCDSSRPLRRRPHPLDSSSTAGMQRGEGVAAVTVRLHYETIARAGMQRSNHLGGWSRLRLPSRQEWWEIERYREQEQRVGRPTLGWTWVRASPDPNTKLIKLITLAL
jgi:hypothetical protein